MSAPIYLDYAATTPVADEVAAAMCDCLTANGVFGNAAATTHAYGREAAARVRKARDELAQLLNCDCDELVFTSGATEANNMAIFGVAHSLADRGRHIISSRMEHKAVIDPLRSLERDGFEVTWLEPGAEGRIEAGQLAAAIRSDTVLVTLMHANNETGAVQDIAAMAAICRDAGVTMHSDAAQSVGKLAVDVTAIDIDLLALTAHKFYGPKGVGALILRRRARGRMRPLILGGGHQGGWRSGTLPTHQIVGLGAAARLAGERLAGDAKRLGGLRERLWQGLSGLSGVVRNTPQTHCLPATLSVSFEAVHGESLITSLPGIAVTAGAACHSADGEPSYVLRALGRPPRLAQATLRLSLGRYTTAADVDSAAGHIVAAVRRLRVIGP
ncbi:MAG: aminotransferase class V-fold PLP-dependent enzyme [Steroidobacteraceae bacterium]